MHHRSIGHPNRSVGFGSTHYKPPIRSFVFIVMQDLCTNGHLRQIQKQDLG